MTSPLGGMFQNPPFASAEPWARHHLRSTASLVLVAIVIVLGALQAAITHF